MTISVSFVVTLFNKAAFLPHLCAGLRAQEGVSDPEYIFVDDGSSDGTPQVLRELTAGWAGVTIIEQPNAGPALALNRALAAVTRDLVKPVDGDDVLLPAATRSLAAAMASTGCSAAACDVDRQGRYDPSAPPEEAVAGAPLAAGPAHALDLLPRAINRARTQPTVWLFRRGLIESGCRCDPTVFIQDYSLELRLAAQGPVAWIEDELVRYPAVAPGRLSSQQAQILHDLNRALLRFLRERLDLPTALRRRAIARAAKRAWLWSSRHAGGRPWHVSSLLRLPAVLGLLAPTPTVEDMLCAPFRVSAPIRLGPEDR